MVQISRQCRGRNQQLAVRRRHDRRQDRREQQPRNERREQRPNHFHEHSLSVRQPRRKCRPNAPHQHRRRQRHRHPNHRNPPRLHHFPRMPNRHEPHQNVRHPHVAQPPSQRRNQCDPSNAFRPVRIGQQVERVRFSRRNQRLVHRPYPSHPRNPSHRHYDDRRQHQHPLDKIRPAHRHEPAHERIRKNYPNPQQQSRFVAQPEHRVEQLRARHESRRRVDQEKRQNHQRRHHPQRVAPVPEALLKEIRYRDAVARHVRVVPQPQRHVLPVQVCPRRQPHRNPKRIRQPRRIRRPGQSQQQPAAHVRRLRRYRRHPLVQLSSPKIEVRHVPRTGKEI